MMKINCLILLVIVLMFVSCSGKRERITSLAQLEGKRICVLTGSAGDIAARTAYPNARFMDMVGSADAALAVKTDKADAFIYDKSVLQKIVEKNPDLFILSEPISKLEVAAAIKKNNEELRNAINSALDNLEKDGRLEKIKQKWVETKYNTSPSVPEIANEERNGILKMGTCAIYEPFSFISNGQHTGLDIELSILIGDMLDKKIEIVDMAFEALIPALQAGKIDFALSDFTITEERKKYIDYSEPYIQNDISVLVKK